MAGALTRGFVHSVTTSGAFDGMPKEPTEMLRESLKLDLQMRDFKPKTIEDYLRHLKTLPERFDKLHVARWIQEASSPSTRRHRYLAINALCRMLVEEDELESNPCERIPMPKEHTKPQPAVSAAELAQLIASCGNNATGVRDRAVILMLNSTGCRRSELAAIKVDDVNLDNSQVLIRNGKNNTWRVAYIDAPAKKAVLRYLRLKKPTGLLFNMSSSAIEQMFQRKNEELGMRVTAHMFRRKFSIDWLMAGGSQVGLMNAAGWTNPTMPARYTQLAAQEIAQREWERMQ